MFDKQPSEFPFPWLWWNSQMKATEGRKVFKGTGTCPGHRSQEQLLALRPQSGSWEWRKSCEHWSFAPFTQSRIPPGSRPPTAGTSSHLQLSQSKYFGTAVPGGPSPGPLLFCQIEAMTCHGNTWTKIDNFIYWLIFLFLAVNEAYKW